MTNEELIDRLQLFACSKELYGCDANALAELETRGDELERTVGK